MDAKVAALAPTKDLGELTDDLCEALLTARNPEDLRLLQDPKWGKLFDGGFHCDRGGTVPLAMLTVFLEAKIALTFVRHLRLAAPANNKASRRA